MIIKIRTVSWLGRLKNLALYGSEKYIPDAFRIVKIRGGKMWKSPACKTDWDETWVTQQICLWLSQTASTGEHTCPVPWHHSKMETVWNSPQNRNTENKLHLLRHDGGQFLFLVIKTNHGEIKSEKLNQVAWPTLYQTYPTPPPQLRMSEGFKSYLLKGNGFIGWKKKISRNLQELGGWPASYKRATELVIWVGKYDEADITAVVCLPVCQYAL